MRKSTETLSFSEFIRTASAGKKKRVYMDVMRQATKQQQETIDKAERLIASASHRQGL